jgi:hypothetical protein
VITDWRFFLSFLAFLYAAATEAAVETPAEEAMTPAQKRKAKKDKKKRQSVMAQWAFPERIRALAPQQA